MVKIYQAEKVGRGTGEEELRKGDGIWEKDIDK